MATAMRTVSFKLPRQLDDALNDLARRRKASRSQLVREALESLTAGDRTSVTTLVDKLIGPLAGPRDLSSNPAYLADYGRDASRR